jgi:hypothetical protein
VIVASGGGVTSKLKTVVKDDASPIVSLDVTGVTISSCDVSNEFAGKTSRGDSCEGVSIVAVTSISASFDVAAVE